jgi:hypothetical protein
MRIYQKHSEGIGIEFVRSKLGNCANNDRPSPIFCLMCSLRLIRPGERGLYDILVIGVSIFGQRGVP